MPARDSRPRELAQAFNALHDGIVDALFRRTAFQPPHRAASPKRRTLQRAKHLAVCKTGA